MDIDAPMSENVYNDFNEPSIRVVWEIVRNLAMPKLLGNRYCPVPFVNKPQNYDMFSVYTKKSQNLLEKVKKIIGIPISQLSFLGKLGDILEYPSAKDKDILASSSIIYDDKHDTVARNFNFHSKSLDNMKEITLRIRGVQNCNSNVIFTMSKAFLKRNMAQFPLIKNLLDNSIYVVTNVCVADSVDLIFRGQFDGIHSNQQWHFDDPIPIGIRLTKFEVGLDGAMKGQERVPISSIIDQSKWDDKKSKIQQLPECESLRLHRKGMRSNATRHSQSLYRIHHESKKNLDANLNASIQQPSEEEHTYISIIGSTDWESE